MDLAKEERRFAGHHYSALHRAVEQVFLLHRVVAQIFPHNRIELRPKLPHRIWIGRTQSIDEVDARFWQAAQSSTSSFRGASAARQKESAVGSPDGFS